MKNIFTYYNKTKADLRLKNKIELIPMDIKERLFKKLNDEEFLMIRNNKEC